MNFSISKRLATSQSVWMITPQFEQNSLTRVRSDISPSLDKDLVKAPIEYLLHFLLIKGDFL